MYVIIIIPILLTFPLVYSSTTCSIFPSLNCSCFQSNIDLNSRLPRKTYSHLYCYGNSLTEKTFQSPFGSDFKYQNYFRTISIEISNKTHLEIQSNQFDSLAMLFSETNSNAQIDISLRFNGFNQITFQKHSLTSTMFQEKHQNKRLFIHLIPRRNNLTQIDINEENETNLEDQFNFSSNCFSGLRISQMTVYIYTNQDRFLSSSSFEQIFNNTNIGELHIHGSIIPPNQSSLKQTFQGLVKSLTLHRHVDTIDSTNFPYYSHVYSYTIHSTEAYSMNLSSFVSLYKNLRGLEILKPRFEVSINQLIPTLDMLTLDIEDLNEKTLLVARHIRHLKLGSRLRTINPEIFTFLSRRLNHFDLSEIDLSQMTTDSLCHLIKYLSKNSSQQQINIIYPQMENLTACNCARLFINHLQFNNQTFPNQNESICSKLCILSDCQTISDYFKEKYPLIINENQLNDIVTETIDETSNSDEHFSSIDLFSDPIDIDMMDFLINQTSEQERNETRRRSTTTRKPRINIDINNNISTIEDIEEYDDIISLTTPNLFPSSVDQLDKDKVDLLNPDQNSYFSWLSFFIGVIVVLLFLFILGLIIFFIVQYRKEHNFKPVPVYV